MTLFVEKSARIMPTLFCKQKFAFDCLEDLTPLYDVKQDTKKLLLLIADPFIGQKM